ncbi:MAG: hypothetical protein WD603_00050 [Patescibacteria group bacterium]
MKTQRDIARLLVDSSAQGTLSADSLRALQDIPGVQHEVGRSLGDSVPEDLNDLLLLSILVDDSGSIAWAKNTRAVQNGHNRVVQVVLEAGIARNVLLQTRFLNGKVVNPYVPLLKADPLDSGNYGEHEFGGTPLYEQSVVLLGSVAAKTRELEAKGKSARSITLIITDGDDQHSGKITAGHVAWLANDLRRSKRHIVAGMGVEDGSTNFRRIFREMGIPDKWHLTPNADPSAIIQAFKDFGEAAAKASIDPASFERLALGPGFSQ